MRSYFLAFFTIFFSVIMGLCAGVYLFRPVPPTPYVFNEFNYKYQAVFLSNNQVYFGKLTKLNSEFFSLTNPHYLQEGDTKEDHKIVRLGDEFHKPENVMYIPQSQIIFIENLQNDTQIVNTIIKNWK